MNSDTCAQGSGAGNWYNTTWVEWSDSNLADYELGAVGPSPLYTSVHNAGRYYGCSANGNSLVRGGNWYYGIFSGLFASHLNNSPIYVTANVGFRCVK